MYESGALLGGVVASCNDVAWAAMAVQHGSDTARFRVRCTYQELTEPIVGPPSAARMPGRTLQGVIATSLPAQSSTWHAERAGFVDGFKRKRTINHGGPGSGQKPAETTKLSKSKL